LTPRDERNLKILHTGTHEGPYMEPQHMQHAKHGAIRLYRYEKPCREFEKTLT